MFGSRTVEDIVQVEEQIPLQSPAKNTEARSLVGGFRGAEQHALQIIKIKKLERNLKKVKGKNKILLARLPDNYIFLQNGEKEL